MFVGEENHAPYAQLTRLTLYHNFPNECGTLSMEEEQVENGFACNFYLTDKTTQKKQLAMEWRPSEEIPTFLHYILDIWYDFTFPGFDNEDFLCYLAHQCVCPTGIAMLQLATHHQNMTVVSILQARLAQ